MFKSLINRFIPEITAYAHCDIPCGLYDPNPAQLAAHTIIRMTSFLLDVKRDNETKAEHDVARVTRVKEEHADRLEEELVTLMNDYFKEEHFNEHPNLKALFNNAFKAVGKARQGIDMDSARDALENVLQIAEIFYLTKNVTPFRMKSIYPTELEIVSYK